MGMALPRFRLDKEKERDGRVYGARAWRIWPTRRLTLLRSPDAQARSNWLLVAVIILLIWTLVTRRRDDQRLRGPSKAGVPFLNPWPDPSLDPRTIDGPADPLIPNIVHYIYGLKPEAEGRDSSSIQFHHYLAVKSALQVLKPREMYWHYLYAPRGWWWDRLVKEVQESGTLLHVKEAREIESIFGQPVEHYAHKADILRLEVLHTYGGIYLDLDLIILRNISADDLHLREQDVVMALEAASGDPLDFPPDSKSITSGLCNAFIMARAYAPFISRWYESYHDFNGKEWALHSVARPWELAKIHQDEVTVLGRGAFFWPLYNAEGLAAIHSGRRYDFAVTRQLGYHMWETQALNFATGLKTIDPERIWSQTRQTSFIRITRRFLTAELVESWSQAKADGLVL